MRVKVLYRPGTGNCQPDARGWATARGGIRMGNHGACFPQHGDYFPQRGVASLSLSMYAARRGRHRVLPAQSTPGHAGRVSTPARGGHKNPESAALSRHIVHLGLALF